jgi:hypothetical protein
MDKFIELMMEPEPELVREQLEMRRERFLPVTQEQLDAQARQQAEEDSRRKAERPSLAGSM